IFSHQVLEHVQNYEQAVSEMRRVLAKDGFCLHIFPPRTSLFEGHTNVPFGALINSPAYYKFWAKLGIRTNNQRELNSKEVAQHNYNYVKQNTNYLPEGELVKVFSKHFAKIDFVEGLYLKYRIQPVGGLIYRLPGVAWGIRTFVSRAILLRV
ncbi:MAG: methyltransferase domain-containing protein, partial [Bdellovibrionales bacterium]|nr:methyltransferase domain-containing protein [Bdellovibrionales bacterium]